MVWGSASALNIIENRAYIGDMVQGQRQVVSFKSKKRRVTEPDEWIIVENTHEPIISRELWDEAQKMRKTREHFHTPKVEREVSIFAGLIRCADCGSTMAASLRGREDKQKITYRCGRYANHGKEVCSSHNIREEVLENIVLNDIHTYAKIAENDKLSLTNQVIRALKETTIMESNVTEKQLLIAERKVDEINFTVKNLYKEKLSGKMPEIFFYNLLIDYEKELKELEEKIPILCEQVKVEVGQEDNVKRWVDNVSKYLKVEKLDRFIARELIDTITVSEFYKVDGKNAQDITINYKFVGNLGELLAKGKEVA
jgi:site-specific DNA recombinase